MVSMSVTFRSLRQSEAKALGLSRGMDGKLRGWGCFVNGNMVFAKDRNGQVVFQNGMDAVAEFLRADARVYVAFTKLNGEDMQSLRPGATASNVRMESVSEMFARLIAEAEAKRG